MADGVVKFAVDKLEEMAVQELKQQTEVGRKVLELRHELDWLRTYLRDAERKRRQPAEANDLIEVWVRQTRELAYDAEDILEEFFHKGELHCHGCFDLPSLLQWLRHSAAGLFARHAIFDDIRDINERIKIIKDQRELCKLENVAFVSKHHRKQYTEWSTLNMLNERDIDKDEEDNRLLVRLKAYDEIENWLLNENDTQQTVIALTGKSGIGKTALASFLYRRSNIRKHFECVIWVHVPQKFRLVDLLHDIIQQAAGFSEAPMLMPEQGRRSSESRDEYMTRRLEEELQGKKYMIVLDDVRTWEEWKFFLATLPDENGSRVLVTTQLKIGSMGSEAKRHEHGHRYCLRPKELKKLDTDQAKQLFCKRVYDKDHVNQEKLDQLDNLLKGSSLPLNVVILAGLLRSKKEDEWERVIESLSCSSATDCSCEAHPEKSQARRKQQLQKPMSTEKILTLSFDDLPPHLKPCFLYFAAFTAEAPIDAAKLVRLWVAEGFVQPRAGQTTEECGGEYLKELISRCLVQLVEIDASGNIIAVSIHQSAVDFTQSEARDTNFLQVHSNPATLSRGAVRRLVIRNTYDTHVSLVLSAPKLHSLFCDIPECGKDESMRAPAKKLWRSARGIINGRAYAFSIHDSRFLRVMDLKGVQHRDTLPKEIGWLIHLRYLGLAHSSLKKLPDSVRKLRNLQTLDISDTDVKAVPGGFWRIRSLRHVLARQLQAGPKEYHVLTDVQTLHGVPWGRWAEKGAAIERMTNLRSLNAWNIPEAAISSGMLFSALAGLECLMSMDLQAANDTELPLQRLLTMPGLRQLQYLKLRGRVAEIKLSLRSHHYLLPNLAKLELYESGCCQDLINVLARLSNLDELVLGNGSYVDADMKVPSSGFPELRKLQLSGLMALTECTLEGDGPDPLPRLRHVSFFKCKSLQKFPTHLPGLRLFTVHDAQDIEKFLTDRTPDNVHVVRGSMPSRRVADCA